MLALRRPVAHLVGLLKATELEPLERTRSKARRNNLNGRFSVYRSPIVH
jgi:hypothetical protein